MAGSDGGESVETWGEFKRMLRSGRAQKANLAAVEVASEDESGGSGGLFDEVLE